MIFIYIFRYTQINDQTVLLLTIQVTILSRNIEYTNYISVVE